MIQWDKYLKINDFDCICKLFEDLSIRTLRFTSTSNCGLLFDQTVIEGASAYYESTILLYSTHSSCMYAVQYRMLCLQKWWVFERIRWAPRALEERPECLPYTEMYSTSVRGDTTCGLSCDWLHLLFLTPQFILHYSSTEHLVLSAIRYSSFYNILYAVYVYSGVYWPPFLLG